MFERRKETNIAIMNKESQKVLDRLVDGKILNGSQSVANSTPNVVGATQLKPGRIPIQVGEHSMLAI